MKSVRRFVLAAALLAPAPFAALAESTAPSVSTDPGALCDRLAGHPDDPDQPGEGVRLLDIDGPAAEAACIAAVTAHPDERRYLFQLGRAFRVNQKLDQALAAFSEATLKNSAMAFYALGEMTEVGDGVDADPNAAANFYDIAANMGLPIAMGALGYLHEAGLIDNASAEEAAKQYERQVAAGDNYGLVDLGSLYQYGRGVPKDEAKAEELFRKAVADPIADLSALGKNGLAWLLARGDRNLDEAKTLIAEAIAFDPDEPAYYDTQAEVLRRAGDNAGAALSEEKAVELDPEQAGYFDRLGDIRLALGEKGKAREAWEKALALDPPNPYFEPDWDAAAVREKIDALP